MVCLQRISMVIANQIWSRMEGMECFILRRTHFIYGYTVKDHPVSKRGNTLQPHGLLIPLAAGAGRSSEVMRWVVGSILHGVDPLSYFSFQPVLHDWCNKGRGMCYPVCGMVHILIDKSSLCGGSGFPFSL